MPAAETNEPPAFELPEAEYARISWEHNEHLHGSLTPLALDANNRSASRGRDGLPRSINVNGYLYSPYPAGLREPKAAEDDTEIRAWREQWLPQIDALIEDFTSFDPVSVPAGGWEQTLGDQLKRFQRVFMGLHRDTIFVVLPASLAFIEAYVEVFGEARREDGAVILQGHPNETSARSAALFALSRLGRADGAVRAAIERGVIPDGAGEAAATFRSELDTLLRRWGSTTTMHLEDLPTWEQDPARPLAMVAAYLGEEDAADPQRTEARLTERRHELERELEQRAAADEQAGRALALLTVARHMVPVSEDHSALGDQRLLAASRARWLNIGAQLHGRALLAQADDVFYLRLAELLAVLEGEADPPLGEQIEARRRQQAQWRAAVPPGRLGAPIDEASGSREVRGLAASAGVYRGRARVIASLEQAAELEHGDVLVCSATAPEWGAYFAIVGAVVTNTGGILTHGAVLAREFAIPAVIGTGDGTSAIPDRATVTVDGSAGTVTIER